MTNGTGNFRNFQISRKEDNPEIFETNFRKMSVPFDFEPEFPEILVEWNAPFVITDILGQFKSFCCFVLFFTRGTHMSIKPGSHMRGAILAASTAWGNAAAYVNIYRGLMIYPRQGAYMAFFRPNPRH